MSNLTAARILIQADLEHARNVLDLWNHQVAELERALAQLDTVGNSRNALRVEYQKSRTRSPVLEASTAINDAPKRGRKPKYANTSATAEAGRLKEEIAGARDDKLTARTTIGTSQVSVGKRGKPRKNAVAVKGAGPAAAKYKDPNSEKTWVGRGRRPDWLTGAPDQYLIRPQE